MRITNGKLLAFYNSINVPEDPTGICHLKSKKLSYAIDLVANRHRAESDAIQSAQKRILGEGAYLEAPMEKRKEWIDFLNSEIEIREHFVFEGDLPDDITGAQRKILNGLVIDPPKDEPTKPVPASPVPAAAAAKP